MTVEELIETLRQMPATAQVLICHNDEDGEPIEVDIARVVYEFGEVSIEAQSKERDE